MNRGWWVVSATAVLSLSAVLGTQASLGTAQSARSSPVESRTASAEPTWIRIPSREFRMGCVPQDRECDENEKPQHSVRISGDFSMMATEVTVSMYRTYARTTGRTLRAQPDWSGDDHPVVEVTWREALEYCEWAGGRLPTEAEWEWAGRGGQEGQIFHWGDQYEKGRANDSDGFRHPNTMAVGSFPPNLLGLYDIAGNVWEWVSDWYDPAYYHRSPSVDPPGPPAGDFRVARGGGWRPFPRLMRLSNRGRFQPDYHSYYAGFRCAKSMR
jgi:formylglycine-generating enzyme required for sulfatase activity